MNKLASKALVCTKLKLCAHYLGTFSHLKKETTEMLARDGEGITVYFIVSMRKQLLLIINHLQNTIKLCISQHSYKPSDTYQISYMPHTPFKEQTATFMCQVLRYLKFLLPTVQYRWNEFFSDAQKSQQHLVSLETTCQSLWVIHSHQWLIITVLFFQLFSAEETRSWVAPVEV